MAASYQGRAGTATFTAARAKGSETWTSRLRTMVERRSDGMSLSRRSRPTKSGMACRAQGALQLPDLSRSLAGRLQSLKRRPCEVFEQERHIDVSLCLGTQCCQTCDFRSLAGCGFPTGGIFRVGKYG